MCFAGCRAVAGCGTVAYVWPCANTPFDCVPPFAHSRRLLDQDRIAMTDQVAKVLERLERNFDAGIDRLFSLLRIESISTDPAYKAECRNAADWCARHLTEAGIPASVRQTTGHPIVVGHDREKV